jgi:ATP phosphoribosyltransferase regulatory subunit HisZ
MLKIKAKDKKRYPLKEAGDYKILEKIYELEKCKLSLGDKKILNLVRTQLENDWRKPLLKFLDSLAKRYYDD